MTEAAHPKARPGDVRGNYKTREEDMKRIGQKALRAIGVSLLLAGIAGGSEVGVAQTKIKIGSPTINDTIHFWMKQFKKKVEAQSDKVEIELYPASQLGAIPRMIEGLQLGTIEMAVIPPAFLNGVDKRFGVLDAPNMLTGIKQGTRTLNDPEFKKVFWGIAEAKGIKILAISCDTPTDYALKTPVNSPSDFKGLKIRIFGSPMEQAVMNAIGATGVPMPLSEVLPALQRGVIDGNKAAITIFVAFKYYNVAKNLFRPKESMICPMKLVSKRWFDALPEDQQKLIQQAATEANDETVEFSVGFVEKAYDIWKQNGGKISELSPDEQRKFNEMLEPIGAKVVAEDAELKEVYEALKAASERSRK